MVVYRGPVKTKRPSHSGGVKKTKALTGLARNGNPTKKKTFWD